MQETIELLFINIPGNLTSAALEVLHQDDVDLQYTSIQEGSKISKTLKNKGRWDLILLSEEHSANGFPILNHVNDLFKKIPVIVLTEQKNYEEIAISAMKRGASDCVSKRYLERLLPVAKRELKNKRKTDLLANAAHDMRTGINSIILSSKLLIERGHNNLKQDQRKFTNAIYHSGHHLLRYLESFLEPQKTSGRTAKENLTTIDLHSFCEHIYQIFLPIARERDIQFEYKIGKHCPAQLQTNTIYLERILTNILSNAFKYTQQKGNVVFTVYSPEPQKKNQSDKIIAFQINDTGIGIPEEKQKQIFNRYDRGSQSDNKEIIGSGLGLDICQQLTNILEGELHIESKVGAGSTFTLYLPAHTPSHQLEKQKPKVKQHTKLFNTVEKLDKAVLVVDDSNIHNLAIKEFLSYKINRCFTANSTKEAYSILQERSIDCIVLDLILADQSGIDVAKYLRKKSGYSNIPIIIYTGKKLSEKERELAAKFVDAIVQKKAGSHNKLIYTIDSFLTSNSSYQEYS